MRYVILFHDCIVRFSQMIPARNKYTMSSTISVKYWELTLAQCDPCFMWLFLVLKLSVTAEVNQIIAHQYYKTVEKRENCHHWGIWPACLESSEEANLRTLLSIVNFPKPQPNVPVACMACDNLINLSCLSLSSPNLFSPPAPLLTLSNSLWKPKELVRA